MLDTKKKEMLNITHATASAAILAACDAGTLIQGRWHDRAADGRELACLLGAIHPRVESPADCNGALMPMWLAELVPVLFDGLPPDAIIPTARRFGSAVARWHVLSEAQWDAILKNVLIRCIDDAVASAAPVCAGKDYWPAVEAVCGQVKDALNGQGDIAARAAAARAVAREAAWAAAAARAARAAARAARAAARSGARAARAAARSGAYNKLFAFVLDQIEAETRA